MPTIKNGSATIYYEEHGKGFPILTFAPAGLASIIKVWSEPMAPLNPITEFSDKYRVIVMDQRNATGGEHQPPGRCHRGVCVRGRVGEGSAADQLDRRHLPIKPPGPRSTDPVHGGRRTPVARDHRYRRRRRAGSAMAACPCNDPPSPM